MTNDRHMDLVRLLAAGMLGSMEAGTFDRSRVDEVAESWDGNVLVVRRALALAEDAETFSNFVLGMALGTGPAARAAA